MRIQLQTALLTLATFFTLFASQPASAYITASFSPNRLDPQKETHIFVVGSEREMGIQFLDVAVSAARRLQEVYPQRQFLFLIHPDKGETRKDLNALSHFGMHVIQANGKALMGADVIEATKDFRQIASLEFSSHCHSVYGSALSGDQPEQRFFQGTPGIQTLRGRFTKYAYINFHGCNAGFVSAPKISKLLQIPVVGHLVGSNFQQLYSDNHWYFNDKGLYPTSGGAFVQNNKISFQKTQNCQKGGCIRLIAEPFMYKGSFGQHNVGLGFRKFFCNYNYGEECFGAMAVAMLSTPSEVALNLSSSKEQYDAAVKDLLCPSDVNRSKRQACIKQLSAGVVSGNQVMSFYNMKEPVCDLAGCHVNAKCQVRKCVIDATETGPAKNIMNEYQNYMKGFDVLLAKNQVNKEPAAPVAKPSTPPAVVAPSVPAETPADYSYPNTPKQGKKPKKAPKKDSDTQTQEPQKPAQPATEPTQPSEPSQTAEPTPSSPTEEPKETPKGAVSAEPSPAAPAPAQQANSADPNEF